MSRSLNALSMLATEEFQPRTCRLQTMPPTLNTHCLGSKGRCHVVESSPFFPLFHLYKIATRPVVDSRVVLVECCFVLINRPNSFCVSAFLRDRYRVGRDAKDFMSHWAVHLASLRSSRTPSQSLSQAYPWCLYEDTASSLLPLVQYRF